MSWSNPTRLTALAAVAWLTGCTPPDPTYLCDANATCPPGQVCSGGTCLKLCSEDNDCLQGNYCNGTYCQQGSRPAPEISSAAGLDCAGAGCLGRGFRVIGTNLGGAAWHLAPVLGGASIPLVTVAVADDHVDLTPAAPETVSEGRYRLVAVNAAGEDETTVELLRGAVGPTGPSGPAGASGPGGPSGPSGPQGIAGMQLERTFYEDQGAATIQAPSRDRYLLKLNADDSSDTAMPVVRAVNDSTLMELCGDADGCLISIGLSHLHGEITPTVRMPIDAPRFGPECRFAISPVTRRWTIDDGCYYDYLRFNGFGEDGADTFQGEFDNMTLLSYRGACFLAESPPDLLADEGLELDVSSGFYFFTGGRTWNSSFPAAELPWNGSNNSPFACSLLIEG